MKDNRLFSIIRITRKGFGQYKWQIVLMVILGFVSGLLEGIGINALIPLFSFVLGDGDGGNENMGYNGNAQTGKFLQYHHNIPSNESPLLFASSRTLKTLSMKLARVETGTITIYKNGSSVATITLTAEDEKIVSGLSVDFISGDELSAEVTSGSIKDPVLILGF